MERAFLRCFLAIVSFETGYVCLAQKHVLVIDSFDAERKELLKKPLSKQYLYTFYDTESKDHSYGNEDLFAMVEDIKSRYENVKFDGVLCTQDYLGNICAALVAQELCLSGPSIVSILSCQHKYYSRLLQRQAVADSTPRFGLIDPDRINESLAALPVRYPFFVKPVKSYFSFGAMCIKSEDELKRSLLHLLPAKAFLKPLNDVLKRHGFAYSADYLLAEELLEGNQVTLEGYVYNNKVYIVGIVDSIMYPGTISFEHFEYPSCLSAAVQRRMKNIAQKVILYIGLNNTFFNIEMMYNSKTKQVHIIEINPRAAAQFADLYEKVDGLNSYDTMLALATSSPLPKQVKHKGRYRIAASFALRQFQDGMVIKAPSQQDIDRVLQLFPDARIQVHVNQGQKLSDELQDGKSYVYAILNLGGSSKKNLKSVLERCKLLLPFDIKLLPSKEVLIS